MSGVVTADRQPVAMTQNRADTSSPRSVVIRQRPEVSSKAAAVTGVELDVAPEVEAVGDMVDVPEDLGLGRIPLAPVPFLLELGREGVRVLEALDVAAGPG